MYCAFVSIVYNECAQQLRNDDVLEPRIGVDYNIHSEVNVCTGFIFIEH